MNSIALTTASPQRLEILEEQRKALHKLRLAVAAKKARAIVMKCHVRLLLLENALCVPAGDDGR